MGTIIRRLKNRGTIERGLIAWDIYYRLMQKSRQSVLIEIGNRIREIRKAQGYSQEAFADEVGLDRSYMGSIERGERNLTIINFIRIAKTLKVNLDDLLPIKTIKLSNL